jgi:hypothetical protein
MAKTLNNQLYFEATGFTNNFEAQVEKIKVMEDADKLAALKQILWTVPGGASNIGKDFRIALFTEFADVLGAADVNEDGEVNIEDILAITDEPVDVDGDEDADDNDIALVKALASTAEVATSEVAATAEVEEEVEDEE